MPFTPYKPTSGFKPYQPSGSASFPTVEPPEVKKSFLEKLQVPTLFPSSPNDSAVKAGFKTAGNVPGSGINFGIGIAKFLNPVDKVADIAKVPFAVHGLNKDVTGLAEGEAGLTQNNQRLIEAIRQNRAEGKDTSRLINQLKINGGSVPPDLKQDIGTGKLVGDMASGLVPSEAPKHLAKAVIAFAKGNPNGEGDVALQQAQEAIVNNPVGEIAPYMLFAKQIADEAGYGKQFDQAIEKTAAPITKPATAIITKTKQIASTMTKFGMAQATALSPDTITTILKHPQEFSSENSAKYTREAIGQETHGAITSRINELRATGKEYEAIKASPGHVVLPDNMVSKILKKYGLKMDEHGTVLKTAESVPLKSGDVTALQNFIQQYGNEDVLSNNGFLNTRLALDQLSEWDATKSDVSNRVAKDLRSAYDKIGKTQVEGLAELDAKYAPEATILKQIRRDYLNSDGTFKDNAISKIANLANKGRESVLSRLEQISPDIAKKVKIVNALEDINRAAGQKTGAYTRATLSGGGALAGIITGNLALFGASMVEAILSEPHNATKILRGYARLRGLKDAASAPIINALKNINEFNAPALMEKGKKLNFGATTEDVSGFLKKSGGDKGSVQGSNGTKSKGSKVDKQIGQANPPAFKGFKDLTTKVLDKLQGRSTVSKQFISDLTNSADMKQAERDLIRKALADEGDVVNVKAFANKVKTELLPLERKGSDFNKSGGKYESISLPEDVRGNVADYNEHIYNSPIQTSAGDVHFSGDNATENYFAHTRVEDMATNSDTARRGPHKTIANDTRRVIELQSDLFQKGNLEKEVNNRSMVGPDNKPTGKLAKFNQDEISKLEPYRNTWQERVIREEVKQAAIDGKTKLQFPTGETAMKIEGLGESESFQLVRNGELLGGPPGTPLSLEANIGQEIIRGNTSEPWIITDVLGDGKFKAIPKERLNTISGRILEEQGKLKDTFNQPDKFIEQIEAKTGLPRNKIGGGEMRNAGYSEADVNKFYDKVFKSNDITKAQTQAYTDSHSVQDILKHKAVGEFTESFDISGKVDTNNPIYKFYEKEVGRYLQNKFDAQRIKDKQGVEWWQVDVKKDMKNKPINAFSIKKTTNNVG